MSLRELEVGVWAVGWAESSRQLPGPRASEDAGVTAARDQQPCIFAMVICRWFLVVAIRALRRSLDLCIK